MVQSDIPERITATVATRNKYYSQRRGSIAADPVDDDDVREEIGRLTFAEQQLRHELLQAVVASNEDLGLPSTPAVVTAEDQVDIEVEEEQHVEKSRRGRMTTSRRPWYVKMLGRRKKVMSLEDEIRRQKEVMRKSMNTIDEGFEDVMQCQTETQEQLIKQSLVAINERKELKHLNSESSDEAAQAGKDANTSPTLCAMFEA